MIVLGMMPARVVLCAATTFDGGIEYGPEPQHLAWRLCVERETAVTSSWATAAVAGRFVEWGARIGASNNRRYCQH